MTNDDKIREKKLQYDIDRKAYKIPTLSYGKNMNILHVSRYSLLITEEAGFTYSSLGINLAKQTKIIEGQ